MNNLLLLGLALVVICFVMNGSKGKSGSLTKGVSKAFKGNTGLMLLVVGGIVLFMCMNKDLVEGGGGGGGAGVNTFREFKFGKGPVILTTEPKKNQFKTLKMHLETQ